MTKFASFSFVDFVKLTCWGGGTNLSILKRERALSHQIADVDKTPFLRFPLPEDHRLCARVPSILICKVWSLWLKVEG